MFATSVVFNGEVGFFIFVLLLEDGGFIYFYGNFKHFLVFMYWHFIYLLCHLGAADRL